MVKCQVEGFRCNRGRRGRPGDTKEAGDTKDEWGIVHAHKWLLSRSKGLFWLKRNDDIYLGYCRLKLFVYGWLIDMLLSGSLRGVLNFNKSITAISLYKKITTVRITWRLFFVCSSCLLTFSLSRAHAHHAMHNLPVSSARFVEDQQYRIQTVRSPKQFVRPFGPQFGLKIKGARIPGPLP